MQAQADTIPIPYVTESVAFLLTVVLIVPLFKRIKVSPILGYLAVGSLIGPYTLGVVKDVDGVRHVAELGVIFLLFTIGLELSFDRLRAFSRLIFGLGSLQVVLTAIAISAAAFAWGNSIKAAVIIGLCLSLSSTAMVMQVLSERGEIASPAGRAAFAVLLLQDLAVVPILILLPILAGQEEGGVLWSLALAVGKAAVTVGLLLALGRYLLRYLFRTVSASRSVDVFTATILLTILAISMVTGLAGLSMALGAFLAGLLLAETEFRHQIESEIEPFKGLLLGLFFMSVGMSLDFALAFQRGIWVLLSVIGLLIVKAAIAVICARMIGLRFPVALRTALLLAESGEFAFVVIGQATLAYDLIPADVAHFMVAVAGLSMVVTPALAALGRRLEERLSSDNPGDVLGSGGVEHLNGHVIIAGFGRVGRSVAAVLKSQAIPYVALDTHAQQVRMLREQGEPVFVGDAGRPELLRHAGVERAAALLITMDNAHAATGTFQTVRRHWPHLPILVRTRNEDQADALSIAGATHVVPETLEASLQMAIFVLQSLGYPRDDANACVERIRRDNYAVIKDANRESLAKS